MGSNLVWYGICAKYLAFNTYLTSVVDALTIINLQGCCNYIITIYIYIKFVNLHNYILTNVSHFLIKLCKFYTFFCYALTYVSVLRATASIGAKPCKIEKVVHFTHLRKKTHISRCKIVHLYTIAIVTVRVCTRIYIYIYISLFYFILFFSLTSLLSPSDFSLSLSLSFFL